MKSPLKVALPVLVLLAALVYAVVVFTRPLATPGDLERLVTGRLNGDAALASDVCGVPVLGFISPSPKLEDLRYGEWPWAKVELQSKSPLFPKDGTATAHVSGVGIDARQKAITDLRAARITFAYHCAWEDNGRSRSFVCTMTAPPSVTRE